MAKLVSKTYGDALYDTAKETDRVDEFFEAAGQVAQILAENPDFARLMNHPKIGKEEKTQMVEEVFLARIPKEMTGLFTLMVAKGRAGDMQEVLMYFIDRVKEAKGIGRAQVVTPMALSEEQRKSVEQRLLETTKYSSFEMDYQVDASLIGGMVIRIGDRVVDSSVKTRLYELTKSLRKITV